MRLCYAALLALILLSGCIGQVPKPTPTPLPSKTTPTAPTPGNGCRVIEDIDYYGDGSYKHMLDLYLPKGSGFPTFVFVHGGAWHAGDRKRIAFVRLARSLARDGVAVALVSYRLAPEVTWREMAEDIAKAVKWVSEHIGEYGGSGVVVLGGHSAGAHLAALVALCEEYGVKVSGLIAWSGVYNITELMLEAGDKGFKEAFTGSSEEWREASPIAWASPGDPPTLVLYGSRNPELIVRQSNHLYKALRKAGVPAELKVLEGETHSSEVKQAASKGEAYKVILEFIKALQP